jgi:uncharacterized phage protein (TIGR02218 family)
VGFLSREQSITDSKPLELYTFTMGVEVWQYTSADHIVIYGGETFVPVFISRSGFSRGNDLNRSALQIDVAGNDSVSMPFRTGLLPAVMVVTITRLHYGDTEGSVIWKGKVVGCKWAGAVATLVADSIASVMVRSGLRRPYQVTCPHVLFGDEACRLNKAIYTYSLTASAISGATITITPSGGFVDGYFVGGHILYDGHYRLIAAYAGGVVTVIDSLPDLAVGDTVILWPGCKKTVAACKEFNNLLNFGGLPFLPPSNPFVGKGLV